MIVTDMRNARTEKSQIPAGGVEVRQVSKCFGDVLALKPTSFRIESGTFVTLLGPSGSGKTTLLKIIAGFEEPTTGSVLIDGSDMTDTAPHRRNVGFVFQQYALFPHLTVAQNIAYPLEMRRMARNAIRERVAETLNLVRLSGFSDRKPSELSGGQQQRVALARAIIFKPPVLLMDEPMAALDKRLREEMQFEIRRFAARAQDYNNRRDARPVRGARHVGSDHCVEGWRAPTDGEPRKSVPIARERVRGHVRRQVERSDWEGEQYRWRPQSGFL